MAGSSGCSPTAGRFLTRVSRQGSESWDCLCALVGLASPPSKLPGMLAFRASAFKKHFWFEFSNPFQRSQRCRRMCPKPEIPKSKTLNPEPNDRTQVRIWNPDPRDRVGPGVPSKLVHPKPSMMRTKTPKPESQIPNAGVDLGPDPRDRVGPQAPSQRHEENPKPQTPNTTPQILNPTP